MAGYSGRPLAKKLGIKPGETVVAINPPANYRRLLVGLPPGAKFSDQAKADFDFAHLFVSERRQLQKRMPILRKRIADTGVIWISWPKKSSGVETDITEDTIRDVALPLGLVDTKVCAVDEIWSGLKLMVRRENRSKKSEK